MWPLCELTVLSASAPAEININVCGVVILSLSLPRRILNTILSPSSACWLVYLDVTEEISYL